MPFILNPYLKPIRARLARPYAPAILGLALVALAAMLSGESDRAVAVIGDDLEPTHLVVAVAAADEAPTPDDALPTEGSRIEETQAAWTRIRVKPGDSLARMFRRLRLPAADLHHIMRAGKSARVLRKLMPNHEVGFRISESGELTALMYQESATTALVLTREGNKFTATREVTALEPRVVRAHGRITRDAPSLFEAGKAAGLSDATTMALAHIFQWDISFSLDMRNGDEFFLVYEELLLDGEKVKDGAIHAAQFINAGRMHRAVRYTSQSGGADYYAPDGRSLRNAFLRDPVHFSYVSSSFNPRRLHPIHKRVMPHRGIDYAARTGTPVVASGDGRIITKSRNGTAGRYVEIQHGERYETRYLHLSAFARGLRVGKKVVQGQTIGYVGSSGLATGPHLHYEFLVDGIHRNPKTVRLPRALPIPAEEMATFNAAISPMIEQMDAATSAGELAKGRAFGG